MNCPQQLQPTKILLLVLAGIALTTSVLGRGGVAIGKNEARDKALAEADKKAFDLNMAEYKKHVVPFIQKHCSDCHGGDKQKGDLDMVALDPDMKDSSSGSRWAVVREKLELDEMPPDNRDRADPEDVQNVLGWIKAEMKRSRRNFARRIEYLNGNKVPHAELFDPAQDAPLDVKPRIRRNSPEIYRAFRDATAKGYTGLVGNPFSKDPRHLFGDMGDPRIDEPTTAQLLRNALTIVGRQTGHTLEDGKLVPMAHAKKEFLEYIDPAKPLTPEKMAEAITREFRYVLGRNPRSAELDRFTAFMEKNIQEAGRTAGVRHALAAVFLLPDAVFRREIGAPAEPGAPTARLTPVETADALAYALGDKRPTDALLKLAADGKLDTPAGVREAIRGLLADERFAKPRILRFFQEFFEYHKAGDVFKNTGEFKHHNPAP